MISTGGVWDRGAAPLYFLAANPQSLTYAWPVHPYLLTPLNDLSGAAARRQLDEMIEGGARMLLDSGAYAVIMQHALTRRVPIQIARTEDPETMVGFRELRDVYVDVMTNYASKVWGYIELDFGNTESKRRLRQEVEAEGLRPIPVYHPLTDPWEYFDELCESYDRVCVSNFTSGDRATRLRLLATISARRADHPDTWMHLLGFTPNEWACAFEFDSCDSSTWLAGTRWPGAHKARAAGRAFSALTIGMTYRFGQNTGAEGHGMAKRAYAYDAAMNQRNWHGVRKAYGD